MNLRLKSKQPADKKAASELMHSSYVLGLGPNFKTFHFDDFCEVVYDNYPEY